jgi:hypothetical protein
MRLRLTVLGCALTGTIGLLALPSATALAGNTVPNGNRVPAGNRVLAENKVLAGNTVLAGNSGAAAPVGPQISVSSPVTDIAYGTRVTLTLTLRRTVADRKVSLYAQPAGQPRKLVATGDVDTRGKWYQTYPVTRTTRFTAVFPDGGRDQPDSASRTLYVYARVADRLTGYYKRSKSGSGIIYDVFHGNGTLTLYSKVWPDKHGECLEPQTEQYDAGAGWHVDTKWGCDALDRASHDTAPFSLYPAVGARYRIRGDYFRSSRDNTNLNQQGPWLYFMVTN